jgi:hypothetical protein
MRRRVLVSIAALTAMFVMPAQASELILEDTFDRPAVSEGWGDVPSPPRPAGRLYDCTTDRTTDPLDDTESRTNGTEAVIVTDEEDDDGGSDDYLLDERRNCMVSGTDTVYSNVEVFGKIWFDHIPVSGEGEVTQGFLLRADEAEVPDALEHFWFLEMVCRWNGQDVGKLQDQLITGPGPGDKVTKSKAIPGECVENQWYRLRVRIHENHTGTCTVVQARVWLGPDEPTEWLLDHDWREADYPEKPADGLIGFQTSSINTLEDDGVRHKLNDFRISLIEA